MAALRKHECPPHIKSVNAALKAQKMTVYQLMQRLGALGYEMVPSTVYGFLSGERGISTENLDAIKAAIKAGPIEAKKAGRPKMAKAGK